MAVKTETIEIDWETARTLQERAAKRTSVSQIVSELASADDDPPESDLSALAELERRWKSVQSGGRTISHDKVVGWLESWGTPKFRPWPKS